MRGLLVIAVCLGAVAAVAYVHVPSVAALWASLSPWGVGVVLGSLLIGVLAGEAARFAKLPRVLGYSTVGLIAVPLHAGILRPTAAAMTDPAVFFDQWRLVFAAGVALTGLAVGLRFDVGSLRSHLRAVFLHSLAHIALVGGAVFAMLWWAMRQVEASSSFPETLPAALVVALLTATSSPSAIYAVNTDLRADGKLPELQILIAVCKNFIIVAGVATLVLLVRPDLSADIDRIPLGDVAGHVGGVLLGGVLFGVTLLGALRWLSGQVIFICASLAMIAAIVWSQLYLELFAGSFIAGIIAGNGSRFGFQLAESLDRSSPFFLAIVFVFAFAELQFTIETLAWVFAVVVMPVRGIAMFLGSQLASRFSSGAGGRHLPYSLFAQSLVALFTLDWLSGFGPEYAQLERLVGPLVLVNLVAGTILHRVALIRSGFAAEAEDSTPADVIVHASARMPGAAERSALDDDRSMLPQPKFRAPALRSDRLNRIVLRLRQRILREQELVAQRFFDARRDHVRHVLIEVRTRLQEHCYETFEELRDIGDPRTRKVVVRERRAALEEELHDILVTYGPTHEPGDILASVHQFLDGLERACQIDAQIRAPEEDVTRQPRPTDNRYQRLRKRIHALNTRFGPRAMRVVPVRALALHHIAHGVPERLAPAIHLDGRFRIYVWQRVANAFDEVSEMYVRTLEHLDEDVDPGAELTTLDVVAAERESEELAAFDRRLQELSVPRTLEEDSLPEVQPLLEDDASGATDDPVLGAWAQLIDEIPVQFEDLERDILDFEADVRRRVALTVDAAYQALLDDLAIAGTFLLPARRIEPATRAAASQKQVEHLDAEIAHWRRLAMATVDRRAMRLGFRDVEHRLREMLDDFVARVETELCSHLTYYPAEISERCDDVVESLQQTLSVQASDADLVDAFVQIRHNLSDFLQDDALRSVQEMREEALFSTLVRGFVEELEALVRDQRTVFVVADEAFLDRPETASALDVAIENVPFQDILDKYLVQTCVASFNELAMRVRTVVDAVATGLGEVNRIIAFNLDAAGSELRPDEEGESNRELVAEFALGGIRRAGENASELLQGVQDEVDGIDDDIVDLTVGHVRTVRRYMFDESMGRLERLAFEVERDRSDLRRRGSRVLAEIGTRARDTAFRVARPARLAAEMAQEKLSLEEYGREELVEDATVATFEWERLSELPLAYRRLFTPTPVEIPELFVTRQAQHDGFESAIARWRTGRKTAVVVTGDLGAGKTSFLHRALAESLSDAKMLRWNVRERLLTERDLCGELCKLFGLRRVDTVQRLLAALADLRGPRVVVVDGIERLFLRTISGSEALLGFLQLIAQSPSELMWLATANASLWSYLATMFAADDFFTDHVSLAPLSVEQTEDLIMRRHRVSGYHLVFRADEAEALTPKRFSDGAQERLRRRYFKRMWEATRGHPLSALYYWLASLDVEDETLFVNPMRPLRTDHLRHLGDDKLIGLGQLVLHEELTENGFATVMRLTPDEARRDLSYFESLNLVVREPGRKLYYRVNEVLYHDLERTLQERNIV